MRRRSRDDADTLAAVFRSLREFFKLTKGELPLRSALVLFCLATNGNEEGNMTFGELVLETGLQRTTTSHIITALIKKKLVESFESLEDRRVTYLRLTEHGWGLIGLK